VLNTNFFTVKTIYNFNSNNSLRYYDVYDQVIYNGNLYECVLGYTHSHADDITINPEGSVYWSPTPSHIKVNESTIDESYLLVKYTLL
jgi:hypothetical protein